tara:strand:+ start:987 stop:1094 length:108 start_codon:yes stop_codon:yes gene_type:complete
MNVGVLRGMAVAVTKAIDEEARERDLSKPQGTANE